MRTVLRRGVNRRRLKQIARYCCDSVATDAMDRAIARGAVSKAAVQRIARRCSDHHATDALDALIAKSRKPRRDRTERTTWHLR